MKKLRTFISAVGGGTVCRLHPAPSFWFGFNAQANQDFHPSEFYELVPVFSGKDKALTCSTATHRKRMSNVRIQMAFTTARRST